ncbi:MAG: glycosyltransferase family 2 protein [Elusimicrobiota bacterium]|jgi:GT2 family glycosyltransferase
MKRRTFRKPEASIIVLCHKDLSYLLPCLESVRRNTRVPYELVLVDNASPDGAYEAFIRLRRTFPSPVRVVHNRENRFFAGGNNQGLALARGRHLMLLNADTLVAPGWLEGLIACVDKDPRLGIVGPYTNQAAGLQVRWPEPYKTPAQFTRWAGRKASSLQGRVRYVPWIIGFCVLIPRPVLEKVGVLDEYYGPGGFEDYDYCLRVRQAGLRIGIAEEVHVHHFGGRGYVDMSYDVLRRRNRELFWSKWGRLCRERLDVL